MKKRVIAALFGGLLVSSCSGECMHVCDSYLHVWIELSEDSGPITLEVCDGSYCDVFELRYGECGAQEPSPVEPGFGVCYREGGVFIERLFSVREEFLPLANEQVSVSVSDASGDELFSGVATPDVVDVASCVEGCRARELRL